MLPYGKLFDGEPLYTLRTAHMPKDRWRNTHHMPEERCLAFRDMLQLLVN